MIARVAVLVGVLGACRPAPTSEPLAAATVGVSIALYHQGETSYGLVDDRREVELAAHGLVLHDVDPAAPLASLVIEPLGGSDLVVGACTRDLELRCEATGRRGRHRVRVLYVAPSLRYTAAHDVTLTTGDAASIATRYAVPTPRWNTRATIALYHGLPGGERSPVKLAEDTIVLDGATAVIAKPIVETPARLRLVYRPSGTAMLRRVNQAPLDRDLEGVVWSTLELDGVKLAPAPLHVRVAIAGEPEREVVVPPTARHRLGDVLRLPLWVDASLRGTRSRYTRGHETDAHIADRYELSVANLGEEPREVWVEETLRTAGQRTLTQAWPSPPEVVGNIARARLVVKPHAIARTGFAVEYAR